MAKEQPLLVLRDIVKVYPGGVVANNHVTLELYGGEVLALLGENGAGKTTLVSIAAGLLRPTSGEILLHGRPVEFKGPRDAMRHGIALVPQNPMLIDNFSVLENLSLVLRLVGRKYPPRSLARLIAETGERYGLRVDPSAMVWSLSMGEKQRVEIVKALLLDARVVLLDEPTTHLSPAESEALARLVRRLAAEGRAVVFITHRLREALAVADRIAVMRRGRLVGVLPRREADPQKLLAMMFGEERVAKLAGAAGRRGRSLGDTILLVDDLWVRGPHGAFTVKGVSLSVRAGEVVGIAGVAGNGQRELFEALAGVRRPSRGSIVISGVDVTRRDSSVRGRLGVAIIPEERVGWALVPGKSLVFNTVVGLYPCPRGPFRGPLVDWPTARSITIEIIERMGVKAPGPWAPADSLSGGNMQRFIAGRELYKKPRLILAMNPTSGLDVEAAEGLRRLLVEAAEAGAGILIVSEDLDELLEVSDRILVMSRGKIVLSSERPFSVEKIAEAMTVG